MLAAAHSTRSKSHAILFLYISIASFNKMCARFKNRHIVLSVWKPKHFKMENKYSLLPTNIKTVERTNCRTDWDLAAEVVSKDPSLTGCYAVTQLLSEERVLGYTLQIKRDCNVCACKRRFANEKFLTRSFLPTHINVLFMNIYGESWVLTVTLLTRCSSGTAESRESPLLAQYLLENIIIAGCMPGRAMSFLYDRGKRRRDSLPGALSTARVLKTEP